MDYEELRYHLVNSQDRIDITKIFDRSGHSPLHYAAYKNLHKVCSILIQFVLGLDQVKGATGGTGMQVDLKNIPKARLEQLQNWINLPSKGDECFTALHFASFHGN